MSEALTDSNTVPGFSLASSPIIEVQGATSKRGRIELDSRFEIDTDIFNKREQASFYVGILAIGEDIVLPQAYTAARRLRYETYNALGWFDESRRDSDGGEHDEHDNASVQFGVIQNMGKSKPMVIATSRLIIKNKLNQILPVEEKYPEAFVAEPAPQNSTEVSRMISQSPDLLTRHLASMACQRAMISYAVNTGMQPAYAMTEPYLSNKEWMRKGERPGQLDKVGIPYREIASPKPIEEYAQTRTGVIELSPFEIMHSMRMTNLHVPFTTRLFFARAAQTKGIGYYGDKFIWRH
jgi:hypothetical protein